VCRSRCYAKTARWADIPAPLLGSGSVNTFPFLGSRDLILQQLDYNEKAVIPMWSVLRCYKQGTKSVDSSVWESMKRGLEPEAEE
jgi:hypothetical protein